MRESPINPYQSPAEAVAPQQRVTAAKRSFLLWRSAAASICFLLGAASLGLAIVWMIGAYDVATRRTGSVSPWFILAISAISGAIGAALLQAGFSTINRQDEKAIRCLSAAIIIFALGLVFVTLQ